MSLPADGRSEYRVQKTHAGRVLIFWVWAGFLYDDGDIESFVAVGDSGMWDFELWWPKFGLRISEIRKDFLWIVDCFCLSRIDDEDDEDNNDEFEQVESGDERYNWWSLPSMIESLVRVYRVVLTSIEFYELRESNNLSECVNDFLSFLFSRSLVLSSFFLSNIIGWFLEFFASCNKRHVHIISFFSLSRTNHVKRYLR